LQKKGKEMANPVYTCQEITNMLYAETGRVSQRLWNKIAPVDPWVAYVPRGEWPKEMGFSINNMMLERTLTDSETGTEWVDAAPSAKTGEAGGPFNNCNPTPEILKIGQTLRTYNVQRRNIQTEDFCINDLMNDFQVKKVLNNMMDILTFVTEWVISNRCQNEYARLCAHQTSEGTPFSLDSTTIDPANPPDSRLLQGSLEQIYQQLVIDGAYQDNGSIGKGMNDQPIFMLFTDAITSRDLIRQDPELRMDFRYADPDQLINTLGTPYSYNGYKHVWIKFPPRYNLVNGAYVRVYPYKAADPTTKGYKRDINVHYFNAQYQDSFVFIPTVYTQLWEAPSTNPGGRLKFDYASHMGEFQFLVIRDKTCNPRGETGFFDALFANASEPGMTHFGYRIRHLNCPAKRTLLPSCYS
jgi:hypothetical protein